MRQFIKSTEASDLVLTIMMWGVFSVLVTRVYLRVANNPMIGFGQWHFAHVLWGGMLMLIAMILVLAFEGKQMRRYGAALCGIGWGLFIDEIGKYLTLDNNYWFRPAIIFIYISFVVLFLIYRYLEKTEVITNKHLFYSVLNNMEEVIEDDFELKEKIGLQEQLRTIIKTEKSSNLSTLSQGILSGLKYIEAKKDVNRKSMEMFIKDIFNVSYNKVFKRTLFTYGLWVFSVYYALDKLIDVVRILISGQRMEMIQSFYINYDFFGRADVYMIVFKMVFEVIASLLFLGGASYFWSKKRILGIRYFKYGIYVSIFFVSIFTFYFEQFSGLYEVGISMILLAILNTYQKEVTVK